LSGDPVKLTPRQREVLSEIATAPQAMNDSYPPAANLLRRGLIDAMPRKWGSTLFSITEAGRQALKDPQP
jgi:hypothetical protein